MLDPVVFPFEYFRTRISPTDIDRLRSSVAPNAYVSIITARCGSTLFSKLCQSTKFGIGEEPFNERPYSQYAFYNPNEPYHFLEQSARLGSIDGRYYFQINAQRFRYLRHLFQLGSLDSWIARYSIILRRNIVAQAFSLAQAVKTGIWHAHSDTAPFSAPPLSDREILDCLIQIHHLEVEAFTLCANQPHTLILTYEDIVSNPFETLQLFLSDCGHSNLSLGSTEYRDQNLTARLPRNFSAYCAFLERHPEFKNVIAERLAGKIPSFRMPEIISAASASM